MIICWVIIVRKKIAIFVLRIYHKQNLARYNESCLCVKWHQNVIVEATLKFSRFAYCTAYEGDRWRKQQMTFCYITASSAWCNCVDTQLYDTSCLIHIHRSEQIPSITVRSLIGWLLKMLTFSFLITARFVSERCEGLWQKTFRKLYIN